MKVWHRAESRDLGHSLAENLCYIADESRQLKQAKIDEQQTTHLPYQPICSTSTSLWPCTGVGEMPARELSQCGPSGSMP